MKRNFPVLYVEYQFYYATCVASHIYYEIFHLLHSRTKFLTNFILFWSSDQYVNSSTVLQRTVEHNFCSVTFWNTLCISGIRRQYTKFVRFAFDKWGSTIDINYSKQTGKFRFMQQTIFNISSYCSRGGSAADSPPSKRVCSSWMEGRL